jgi:SNF2 family DNA or RNA helicase
VAYSDSKPDRREVEVKRELWAHQVEDIDKFSSLEAGLIGSEMGAGKTLEAVKLEDIWAPDSSAKSLVVAPLTTLEPTWLKHFSEEVPGAHITVCDPKRRQEFADAVKKGAGDIFVVHWDALRLLPGLAERRWSTVVADECQRMKNRKAQQTQALKRIRSDHRLALSGTAADNMAHDLWSTLNWLYPMKYRSYWRWYKENIDFEIVYPQGYHKVKGIKPERLQAFLDEIRPFYIRHLKKEPCCPHHPQGVMPWLPDKYYSTIWVDLTPQQRRAYDQMKKEMLAWVGEHEDKPVPAPVAITQLVRLQQFASAHLDVHVLEDEDAGRVYRMCEPSSKLDAVIDIIGDTDEPIVVFSQFRQMVDLLAQRLRRASISHGLITGKVPSKDRARVIGDFQAGRLRVVAGTIKAGGIGIDLYRASTVVFLDRDWSPSANKQAEDRLWRAGQKNAVQVIDIMARNTVDFGRKQAIDLKWTWIKQALGDTTALQYFLNENGGLALSQGLAV